MKKILVVDDEKPISDIVKFSLSKEGFEVITAFDGEEGLNLTMSEIGFSSSTTRIFFM